MSTTCNEMLIRIKLILKELKIPQEQLAEAAGISVWTLSKQLNGVYKLNIDILFALFRYSPLFHTQLFNE